MSSWRNLRLANDDPLTLTVFVGQCPRTESSRHLLESIYFASEDLTLCARHSSKTVHTRSRYSTLRAHRPWRLNWRQHRRHLAAFQSKAGSSSRMMQIRHPAGRVAASVSPPATLSTISVGLPRHVTGFLSSPISRCICTTCSRNWSRGILCHANEPAGSAHPALSLRQVLELF